MNLFLNDFIQLSQAETESDRLLDRSQNNKNSEYQKLVPGTSDDRYKLLFDV